MAFHKDNNTREKKMSTGKIPARSAWKKVLLVGDSLTQVRPLYDKIV